MVCNFSFVQTKSTMSSLFSQYFDPLRFTDSVSSKNIAPLLRRNTRLAPNLSSTTSNEGCFADLARLAMNNRTRLQSTDFSNSILVCQAFFPPTSPQPSFIATIDDVSQCRSITVFALSNYGWLCLTLEWHRSLFGLLLFDTTSRKVSTRSEHLDVGGRDLRVLHSESLEVLQDVLQSHVRS